MHYQVGVDAGGTRTRALLAQGGTVLAEGQGGAANPRQVGWAAAHAQLEAALLDAFRRAGRRPELNGCTVFAGVAGLATEADVGTFTSFPHPYARLEATSDALLALDAYFSGSRGALLIVGTGCVALARAEDGSVRRRMGWGFPLEMGGGADLGLQAVRLGLLDWENRSASPHRSALEREFASPRAVIEHFRGAPASDYARFAPNLLEGARLGRPRALEAVQTWVVRSRQLLEGLRQETGVSEVGVWGGLAADLLEFVQLEGHISPRRAPLEEALLRASTDEP